MGSGFQAVRAAGKNSQIRTLLKNRTFLIGKIWDFLTIWWKAPFSLVENQKKEEKDGYLGDPARGQADPGSTAVYTTDWPGPVIYMYFRKYVSMGGNGV